MSDCDHNFNSVFSRCCLKCELPAVTIALHQTDRVADLERRLSERSAVTDGQIDRATRAVTRWFFARSAQEPLEDVLRAALEGNDE